MLSLEDDVVLRLNLYAMDRPRHNAILHGFIDRISHPTLAQRGRKMPTGLRQAGRESYEWIAQRGAFRLWDEELVKAGVMLAGEGLHPSSKGKRLHISGGKKTLIDGPFAETKELVGGYWIW
ncbi:YciI family protein [Sorangium sp. So ce726]